MGIRLVQKIPAQAELGRGTLRSKMGAIVWATRRGECFGEFVGIFDSQLGDDGSRLIVSCPFFWSVSRYWMRESCGIRSIQGFPGLFYGERVPPGFRKMGSDVWATLQVYVRGFGGQLGKTGRLIVSCP